MAAFPAGTPCWADAMFKDFEGAKKFYGEVLGWTFSESAAEFGNYTQALKNGKAVAAVVPPMPGQEDFSAWCLYFATDDVNALAGKIRENGGDIVLEPMEVGPFGSMLLGRDPSGVTFGAWQAGDHHGFEAQAETGAYCWAEVFTRDPDKTDPFYPAVFGYTTQKMSDDEIDFSVFNLDGKPVLGRMKMTEDFPAEVPPWIQVYFAVDDCDVAVARTKELGGEVHFGPMTSPFGRFAAVTDPQGAAFAVIDLNTTEGEMPKLTDV